MKMKRNEEDEIQVLGTTTPKSRWKWIIIIISVLVVLLLLCLFLFRKTVNEQDSDIVKLKEDISRVVQDSTLHTEESAVRISKDSINDVPLTIYSLINLKAELTFDLPSKNDSTIFLVVQAADIRRDNKEILGDYVFKGKQLSTGKRKIGYCAIIDGNVSLGVSLNDEVKDYCIANNGYFFRQYALVIDGEVQENQLKGKAVRRALAKQGDDLYIIQSRNRESLYDFSEALADFGISDAIYLVGGDAYIVYRNNEDEQLYEDGDNNKLDYPTINYIAFKKKNNH